MRFIGIVLTAIVVACSDGRPQVGGDCEVDSGGKVCSAMCETDQACVDMAKDAGASSPDRAQCGDDRRCDLVGTGLGSFVCA